LNMTRETAGHVSARIPGTELVLIKARGRDEAALTYTTPDDLCVVDMDGKMVEGRDGLAAPQEVFIHTEVLRSRPDVHSVIHIHPPNIVAYTIAEKPLLPIVGGYNPGALALILKGVPNYPRSVLINTQQRGRDVAELMGGANICTMRGHGITSAGATVEDATLTAINLNDLAELQLKADTLGGAKPIPDEDLKEFGSRPERAAPAGPRPPSSTWKYYDRLLRD